jgi:hypothetical protein
VLGAFTFAAADFPSLDFWKNRPVTGGYITSGAVDYNADCLAEYTAKVRGRSFLPSRRPAQTGIPFEALYAGIITLFSEIESVKPVKVQNNRNAILLKLRI